MEQEGTYPLPEAQVDRFMMKLVIGYPTRTEELAIPDAMATSEPNMTVQPVVTGEEIMQARRVANGIFIDQKVREYVVDLVLATRDPKAYGLDLGGYMQYGASPRATINLTLAAKAAAFVAGRGYVTPQNVKALAPDVLRHRISVSYEAEAENLTSEDIIPRGGTDVASAIQEAEAAFGPSMRNQKILVLITDGEDLEAKGIDAAKAGLKVYTIGVGSTTGDPVTLRLEVTGTGAFDRLGSDGLASGSGWKPYPAKSTFTPTTARVIAAPRPSSRSPSRATPA